MPKKKKEDVPIRYVWIKDKDRSLSDFDTYEQADEARQGLEDKLKNELKKDEYTLRTRLRSRTGKFDVLVKIKTEVKAKEEPKKQEVTDAPQP